MAAAGQVCGLGTVGEAVGGGPGAAAGRGRSRRRARLRAGRGAADRRGRLRGRGAGHPGHGGPHHRRQHAGGAGGAAQGPSRRRCRDPGDAAAHPEGPGGADRPRIAGASGQGRLPRARLRGVHRPRADRPRLCARAQGADERQGLSDGGLARPADRGDRCQAGRRRRAHPEPLGTPDAVRDPARRADQAGRRGQDGAGLHPLRHGLVRLLRPPARRAPREPAVLRPLGGQPWLTPRLLGAVKERVT